LGRKSNQKKQRGKKDKSNYKKEIDREEKLESILLIVFGLFLVVAIISFILLTFTHKHYLYSEIFTNLLMGSIAGIFGISILYSIIVKKERWYVRLFASFFILFGCIGLIGGYSQAFKLMKNYDTYNQENYEVAIGYMENVQFEKGYRTSKIYAIKAEVNGVSINTAPMSIEKEQFESEIQGKQVKITYLSLPEWNYAIDWEYE
jgi:hypothetical protein